MSCYKCTKEFTFFNREAGCSNCGFGFCSSCLKYKAQLPGKGPKEHKVCQSCHQLVSQPSQVQRMYAPPEALQKRLDSLESPGGKPSVTVYRNRDKMTSLRRGLSTDDQKIVDRLEQLHRERRDLKPVPSEQEVRDRLDRLKGSTNVPFSTPSQAPDTRSNVEKSHDLLAAVSAEVELDTRHQPVLSPEADIAHRLARLKGEQVTSTQSRKVADLPDPITYLAEAGGGEGGEEEDIDEVAKLIQSVNKNVQREAVNAMKELEKDRAIQEQLERLRVRKNMDTEEARARIRENDTNEAAEEDESDDESSATLLKQILAEQELEARLGVLEVVEGGEMGDEPSELPWCVLCNADAVLRCLGCGEDLYCASCFREAHQGEDMEEHRTRKFVKK